ncbi:MAG: hypothetical protein E7666_03880 [Ruminococcaceae bacterium]|nr:hypothetical protein [Oscillospiraceae bacterium]
MKKRLLAFFLCLLVLLSAPGCAAERYSLLYRLTVGPITYCVRGNGTRPRQIVLKADDEVIWTTSVKVSSKVGAGDGTYGFEVLDLNFDGYQDFMIPNNVSGECTFYLCWLWDPESGDYRQSKELSGLANIRVNNDMKALFTFAHSYEEEKAYPDAPAATISTDSTTKFIWKDGKPIPEIRASITYYSEFERYCYAVAYYDEDLEKFGDSDDRWLTPAEYAERDMSFLYYFRNDS